MMNVFSQHFDAIQDVILGREYDETVTRHCACGSGPASFRCEECFCYHPTCQQCLLHSHRNHPLHHVQEWIGTHFTRRSLRSLGLTISLGHHANRCPNAPLASTGRKLVLVHTNGLHGVKVEFCHCGSAPPSQALQLTAAGFFPATMDKPETCFTFTLLDDFHVHTLASKKSAYDHFSALQKHTNGTFPHLTNVSLDRQLIDVASECSRRIAMAIS
jgi:hypothetical protein